MENIKNNLRKITPLLNKGERIQKSLFGTFQELENENSIPIKGILCATNERICFYSEEIDHSFSALDYYKIDSVDILPSQLSLLHEGIQHSITFIEEGDLHDFNHYVLDRMEIKA
ncbi:MAG: hypothetical protein KBT36_05860 [Kurthia sp.]|nr:hypothetical protein [Candidatus Kurthia equi]